MKKIFISGAVLTVIALISYFLIADDGGDFTVPAQRTQGVQCAGCLDIWDGKGQFVDMIWEASPLSGTVTNIYSSSSNPCNPGPAVVPVLVAGS